MQYVQKSMIENYQRKVTIMFNLSIYIYHIIKKGIDFRPHFDFEMVFTLDKCCHFFNRYVYINVLSFDVYQYSFSCFI